MPDGRYTYNPENITKPGIDRMRFELGDTMVEGGPDTTALTNMEIQAAIEMYPKSWKRAKLMLMESIFRRFSYEADTRTGPMTLSLQERAKLWKSEYENLKKEISAETCSIPEGHGRGAARPPYFFSGMHENSRVKRGGI